MNMRPFDATIPIPLFGSTKGTYTLISNYTEFSK